VRGQLRGGGTAVLGHSGRPDNSRLPAYAPAASCGIDSADRNERGPIPALLIRQLGSWSAWISSAEGCSKAAGGTAGAAGCGCARCCPAGACCPAAGCCPGAACG